MFHHLFVKPLYCVAVATLVFLPLSSAFAIDNIANRKRIASSKSKKFYQNGQSSRTLLLAGDYDSDENSKQYQLDARYFFQSYRQMHEVDFLHQTQYANLGTTPGRAYLVKKSDQYDVEISSKIRLKQTNNYLALYSRSDYDELSKYYYDLRNAVGVGRIFFNDKLELDGSIGYRNVKAYGNGVFFVPSMRLNIRFSPKFTLIHRGYVFIDHEGFDDEFKTSLRYKLSKTVSFEVNHTFDQRRYEDDANSREVIQIHRFFSMGLVFDLN